MTVAIICVHGPLKTLAGGTGEHTLAGETVSSLLRALEREYPALAGWVLDERGLIRRHINVYVNGERGGAGTTVREGDRVEVLPAISGGAGD
jgi:molybdopterin synthase sulfur carrier subunit